jgi:hypothetical protein
MKKILKLSGVAIALLLVGGCTTTPDVKVDKAGSKIENANTSYTTILKRLNTMIGVFEGKPMNVQVYPIENKSGATAKLPADITEIVKTSFNKIGGVDNSFVRLMFNEASEGYKKGAYVITGAITQFDVISSKNKGNNATGTGTVGERHNRFNTEGTLESEEKTTKLTINFNPVDPATADYIPGTSTDNTVTIEKKSNSNEFAFSILGSGFGFNNSVSKSQGVHKSIQVLVELSVVELLGKLGKFPYWLLLGGGQVNQDVISHLSKEFLREPLNKRIQQVSYLLSLHGKNVQITRVMNNQLKQAIIEYKREKGMKADNTLSKSFYTSLLNP